MRYDRSRTQGRWHSLLASIGVQDTALTGHNAPCPMCGGKDRFRFLDTDGSGTWICNKCGSGDGMHLVQQFRSVDFKEATRVIDELLPGAVASQARTGADPRSRLRATWLRATPLGGDDPATLYLKTRGVWSGPPDALRCNGATPYFHEGKKIGTFPAMVALVRRAGGVPTTLHVTYLDGRGGKADVPSPKKVMSTMGVGAHIRLFDGDGRLNVAEGIETALAVRRLRNEALCATISAQGMASFVVPEGFREVTIWGDNDASYTGQAAAYAMAQRCVAAGLSVEVKIPTAVGRDWADEGVA